MTPYKITPLVTAPLGIVIAGGPSLNDSQIEQLTLYPENLFIVGVNNAFEICAFLNVLYAADDGWWKHHADRVPQYMDRFSTWDGSSTDKPPFPIDERINYLKGVPGYGFATNTDELVLGGHGGHHAIQIAMHYGCRRILLLGLDMRRLDGKAHWFGDYKDDQFNRRINYDGYLPMMNAGAKQAAKRGVEIVNCSSRSALTCFPKQPLRKALYTGVATVR